ncbi:AAA family ATPase [Enterorhabdus mucosicola]|uniref:AAA family ATPase n=1 Tax=Adlercreutzia mucosicola TaxID=580026 RepID=A0A6N8JLT2_9ACTN|nr:AAA family ATPase [Adlercreutzia mucosicola]MVX60875.1 AAA family ATPase [Adlercreutzia mucosicola]
MSDRLSSIRGIHIQSGMFGSGADFELFRSPNEKGIPHRVSILFGRNGSGKTTISQQIGRISAGEDCDSSFWGEAQSSIALTAQDRNAIRVFDEEYVRKTVLLREEGLDTIVMLGTKAQAQKRIDEIDVELVEVGRRLVEWSVKKEAAESGPESLDSLLAKAKNEAKAAGWAERSADITGSRSNLTSQKWDAIVAAETDRSRHDVETEYDEKLVKYKKAEGAGATVIQKIKLIDSQRYSEAALVSLLSKTLDEPILTEREERIFSLVQNGKQQIVEYAKEIASDEEIDTCPLCQQELTTDYKESLRQSVLKVLNDEVDSFKRDLEKLRISPIEENELGFFEVPENFLSQCRIALEKVNDIIAEYNQLIERRLRSLYEPVETGDLNLSEAISFFNTSAINANKEIDTLNDAVKGKTALRQQLLSLNDQLARIDAKATIGRYEATKKDLEEAKRELDKAIEEREKLTKKRQAEEAKMSLTDLAANAINGYLANVFFDSTRFVLVPYANVYKIESHGKSVRPQDVSTGERNILALCYFFSEGGRGKFEGSEDSDPQYLVLDDPISSFDMENRIGICSLIRDRAAHVLESNPNSLITITTHDIGIASELKHTFDDLGDVFKGTSNNFITDYLELSGDTTCDLPMRKSRYSILLKRAYDFAISSQENEDESYVIGNILRRILEGYSSFNYGIGIERLSRDQDLASRFGAATRLISSVMYRLALNDESHLKECLDALNPPIVFDRYSYQEKMTIAQCVFVILDYLDEAHVVKQLVHFNIPKKDIEDHIGEWRKKFISEEDEGHQSAKTEVSE